jgi:hypothetical protein
MNPPSSALSVAWPYVPSKPDALTANTLFVCHHNFPQRPLTVLDSTGNGEDAFTTARWNTGSVDHLHALFSGNAIGRVFLCNVYSFMDGSSKAGSSAQLDTASFLSLLTSEFH